MTINFLKQYVDSNNIKIIKVPSARNRADILTKETFASYFQEHADDILLGSQQDPTNIMET